MRPTLSSVRLAERPSFLTVGSVRLVLLCGVIVAIGMLPGRLSPSSAGWVALVGLIGIPLAIAVPFLASVRALAQRLPLATAALRAVNHLGLVGLGAAFFLVWTFIYLALWWAAPARGFHGPRRSASLRRLLLLRSLDRLHRPARGHPGALAWRTKRDDDRDADRLCPAGRVPVELRRLGQARTIVRMSPC